jgi:hypothetical protein
MGMSVAMHQTERPSLELFLKDLPINFLQALHKVIVPFYMASSRFDFFIFNAADNGFEKQGSSWAKVQTLQF